MNEFEGKNVSRTKENKAKHLNHDEGKIEDFVRLINYFSHDQVNSIDCDVVSSRRAVS